MRSVVLCIIRTISNSIRAIADIRIIEMKYGAIIMMYDFEIRSSVRDEVKNETP